MTNDQRTRLLELCNRSSQDSLTEPERCELQDMLRGDPEARRAWFAYQDMELSLRRMALLPDYQGLSWMDGVMAAASNPHTVPEMSVQTNARSAAGSMDIARRYSLATALTLLCVSAIVMLGVYVRRQPTNMAVAGPVKEVALVSPTDNSELLLSKQNTKFVVLHFLLKSECPFCLEVTHDYAKLQETMPDVLHVFLKPDDSNTIREWSDRIDRHDLQRNPIIYRDPDATLAKQFGIPDGYEFHGQSIHYPALVILDSSGKEIFRYVGKDNTDRMPASEFVQKLSAIESSG